MELILTWLNQFWRAAGKISALILCGIILLYVISQPAIAQVYIYDEVVVEGNLRIDRASILRFADLPPSGQATADEFGSAYRRIADAALFESFEIKPEGRQIIISVVEYPVINEITIEGNQRIPDEQLFPLVSSSPRRVYLPSQAQEDAAAIADRYRLDGRFEADVLPKIIRRSDNRVDLVFEVIEGGVVETERISFIGNRSFSTSRLRRELASSEAGILRAFIKSDTYIEERIAEDRQSLTEFYLARGFVDFEILSVSSETTAERDAFFVVFTIREGPQYRFGNVTASSDLQGIETDEYLQEFTGETGNLYMPSVVLESIRRMEFLANRNGLRFVLVEPEENANVETRLIDLNFRIYRGERIFLERINITGNSTTLDRVIRREFRIAEGDPFNQREISDAAGRLRDLRYFSSVSVDTEEGSSPNQVVVNVQVVEAPTGSLVFGGAWSQDAGVTGKVAISERNLLGRGQTLSFGIETGRSTSYTFSFTEPRFLDRELLLIISTSLTRSRGSRQAFQTERWQASGSLVFPMSETVRLSAGGGFTTFRMENVASSSFIVRDDFYRGAGDIFFLSYSMNYDSRRVSFSPDSGYVLGFGQEFGKGTADGSTTVTTKMSARGQTFVLDDWLKLTGEFEGGFITPVRGATRIRDRFRMTSSLMRGFGGDGIGPRDFLLSKASDGSVGKTYLDPLGGNYFVALRLESRFPLGLPDEIGLEGGLFYDIGSIWGLNEKRCANHYVSTLSLSQREASLVSLTENPELASGCVVDDGLNLRSTVGFSLFWETLFGPIRLNFSRPLTFEPYDNRQSFDLAIASTF